VYFMHFIAYKFVINIQNDCIFFGFRIYRHHTPSGFKCTQNLDQTQQLFSTNFSLYLRPKRVLILGVRYKINFIIVIAVLIQNRSELTHMLAKKIQNSVPIARRLFFQGLKTTKNIWRLKQENCMLHKLKMLIKLIF